jgi:hypothetical protein
VLDEHQVEALDVIAGADQVQDLERAVLGRVAAASVVGDVDGGDGCRTPERDASSGAVAADRELLAVFRPEADSQLPAFASMAVRSAPPVTLENCESATKLAAWPG